MENYAKYFPFKENRNGPVYFDNSATTQKPKSVIDSAKKYLDKLAVNTNRSSYKEASDLTNQIEEIRSSVAKFIGAESPKEIVYTGSSTAGINLLVDAWGLRNLQTGDEIILSLDDHNSLVAPWYNLKDTLEVFGIDIKITPIERTPAGCFDLEDLKNKSSQNTKLVVLSHIHNVYGIHSHVESIREIVGIDTKILADLSQSIGHIPIDVKEMNIDFAVFSGHKMYSLAGVGILYVKQTVHNELFPANSGGGSIKSILNNSIESKPMPHLLEGGTKNAMAIISLGEAIKFINDVKPENVHSYLLDLTQYLIQGLREIPQVHFLPGPATVKCATGYGIVSFQIEGMSSQDVGFILGQNNIYVRTGLHCTSISDGNADSIRISMQIYNSKEEIDKLVSTLTKIVERI